MKIVTPPEALALWGRVRVRRPGEAGARVVEASRVAPPALVAPADCAPLRLLVVKRYGVNWPLVELAPGEALEAGYEEDSGWRPQGFERVVAVEAPYCVDGYPHRALYIYMPPSGELRRFICDQVLEYCEALWEGPACEPALPLY